MSWAAHRETTREEYMAYCLLFIFDVNMPLLYGEGLKAFQRLQEAIIRTTVNFSILAWKRPKGTIPAETMSARTYCGVLADAPSSFAESNLYKILPRPHLRELAITELGIKTMNRLLLVPIRKFGECDGHRYVLPPSCTSSSPEVYLGIRLRKCGLGQFIRENPWSLFEYTNYTLINSTKDRYPLTQVPKIHVPVLCPRGDASLIPRMRSPVLQITLPSILHATHVWPWGKFDHEDQAFFLRGNSSLDHEDYGALRLTLYSTLSIDGHEVDIVREFFFYAIRWASQEAEDIQCSLLDACLYDNKVRDMQSVLRDWDPMTNQFVRRLMSYAIPKVSACAFPINGADYHVVVTFQVKAATDASICFSNFWEVEFSCAVCSTKDLPSITVEWWETPAKMKDSFYSAFLPSRLLHIVGTSYFT